MIGIDSGCAEAARQHEIPQRLGMQRPDVRDVPDEALEKSDPAGGVERFEDERCSGTQGVMRELEKPEKIAGLEMLDDLRREQTPERSIGHAV